MNAWIDVELKVVTPLFTGDDPDQPATIRVASIRGALRYWFRAVAAGYGLTNPQQLWEHEEEIFGSARHGKPSAIALRIDTQPRSTRAHNDWTTTGGRTPLDRAGTISLLGQGLWDIKEGLLRSYIPPKSTITLRIRLSGNERIDTRLAHAFWAWITFGGLGARTRRGFGRLTYHSCTATNAFGWDDDHLTPPSGREAWNTLLQNPFPPDQEYFELAAEWPETSDSGTQHRPEFPTLAPPWWRAKLFAPTPKAPLASWAAALDHAGQQWRNFTLTERQQRGSNTPEWRHVIQGNDTRFPRGALGLPVGYHRHTPPFKTEVTVDSGRRASPIWMYPIGLDNGNGKTDWTILTHAFRSRLLPEDTRVYATHNPHASLDITDDMLDTALDAWFAPTIRARIPTTYYSQP